jgi:hypothetical protein
MKRKKITQIGKFWVVQRMTSNSDLKFWTTYAVKYMQATILFWVTD